MSNPWILGTKIRQFESPWRQWGRVVHFLALESAVFCSYENGVYIDIYIYKFSHIRFIYIYKYIYMYIST